MTDLSQGTAVFVAELIALAFVCLALSSIFWSTLTLGISPMPTSTKVKRELLALIPAELEGEVHELGAGWGTLAWAIATKCPRARVIGWERSLVPFLFCRLRLGVQRRDNLSIRFGDFHRADLKGAQLVIAYLWTGAMTRLGPKFEAELPNGSTVISHTFAWRGKQPESTVITADLYRTPLYRYRIVRS
ncbi:MAG: SAM-dependent methyltransferase [Archangium sp.]|nr:SAM-dependent methyltransferase [Archangium sp.]MDP3570791.1 SAM-dependent methyltransferase [Archangium sp.]